MKTNLDYALAYARRWPVFPVVLTSDGRKVPVTSHGYKDATTDAEQINAWWERDPEAMPATPTGRTTGLVVLDVDVKNGVHGWDALEDLGALPLPDTPHAHTPSGGTHVYFAAPEFEVRNSAGKIGAGLDVRGGGGSIILPAPSGGYWWDPHLNLKTPLAPLPDWLAKAVQPKPQPVVQVQAPNYAVPGLSPFGRGALDGAGRDVMDAPAGAQESTLNARAHWIGRLVGGGEIPRTLAFDTLLFAAKQMPNHDPRRPWRLDDLARKISAALDAGMKTPAIVPAMEPSYAARR